MRVGRKPSEGVHVKLRLGLRTWMDSRRKGHEEWRLFNINKKTKAKHGLFSHAFRDDADYCNSSQCGTQV